MAPASVLPPGGRARRLDGEEPQQSFSFVQPWGTSSGEKRVLQGGWGVSFPGGPGEQSCLSSWAGFRAPPLTCGMWMEPWATLWLRGSACSLPVAVI